MSERIQAGLEVFAQLCPDIAAKIGEGKSEPRFGDELGILSADNLFGALWTRPGLDWRSRSLVTIGALIALRANDQLTEHFQIGLRNGLTRAELEEVIYHLSGYLGFPAAANASQVAAGAIGAHKTDEPIGASK